MLFLSVFLNYSGLNSGSAGTRSVEHNDLSLCQSTVFSELTPCRILAVRCEGKFNVLIISSQVPHIGSLKDRYLNIKLLRIQISLKKNMYFPRNEVLILSFRKNFSRTILYINHT